MEVSLSRPDISNKEIEAVLAVLRTPTLSIGPKVAEFEKSLASYVGVKYGIAVNSGTSGLHLLVRSLGIKAGDEVITTPFSFVASSNCILFEGATPVFADIDEESLNINPEQIVAKLTPRTKAILPVDVFGRSADMEALKKISEKYNIPLIEDACEALGTDYRGKKAGSLATAAVFAFYPNKQITTGEGGMIVTDNPEIAMKCRSMRNQGRAEGSAWLEHERLGYNYRLNEMSAALGVAQMERLGEILAKRASVVQRYNQRLNQIDGIQIPIQKAGSQTSWFVYVIRIRPPFNRDKVMDYLNQKGVQCRPYFKPIHLQGYYRKKFGFQGGEFPVTEAVAQETLALPFFNNITDDEIDYVVQTLKNALKKFS